MAIKANIVIDQGSDFTAEIALVDENEEAYDLTDHTVLSSMRKNYASETAIDFSTAINADATTGLLYITMPNTLTSTLEPGRYLYDVIVTNSLGSVTRVVEGIAVVTPGITRD